MSRRVGDEMPLSVAWLSAARSARKFRLNGITQRNGCSFLHIIDPDRVHGKIIRRLALRSVHLDRCGDDGRLERIRIDRSGHVG